MAGYYQIDTATLSACITGKQIIAFIPTDCKGPNWKAVTVLNGFEISSVAAKTNFNTPFEVQLIVNAVN